MRFGELKTGDVITLAGQRAVVLSIEKEHPTNPGFLLVVWWIFNANRLSFDALHPDFELIPGAEVHQDGLMSWRTAVREASRG